MFNRENKYNFICKVSDFYKFSYRGIVSAVTFQKYFNFQLYLANFLFYIWLLNGVDFLVNWSSLNNIEKWYIISQITHYKLVVFLYEVNKVLNRQWKRSSFLHFFTAKKNKQTSTYEFQHYKIFFAAKQVKNAEKFWEKSRWQRTSGNDHTKFSIYLVRVKKNKNIFLLK